MCTLHEDPQKMCAHLKNDLKESAQISTSTPQCACAHCARECTSRTADAYVIDLVAAYCHKQEKSPLAKVNQPLKKKKRSPVLILERECPWEEQKIQNVVFV